MRLTHTHTDCCCSTHRYIPLFSLRGHGLFCKRVCLGGRGTLRCTRNLLQGTCLQRHTVVRYIHDDSDNNYQNMNPNDYTASPIATQHSCTPAHTRQTKQKRIPHLLYVQKLTRTHKYNKQNKESSREKYFL